MKADFPQADIQSADIQISMNNLVVLYAGSVTSHALETLAGGAPAVERALSWAEKIPDVSRILFLSSVNESSATACKKLCENHSLAVFVSAAWNASSFFMRLQSESDGFDHVFIAMADCPFLDVDFTGNLYKKHLRYAAEYSFADGYPYGFAPEILACGIVPVLANLAKDNTGAVTRDLVFETVKKDINSFDIETDIAPTDLRQLRLVLACDTRRNAALCASLDGIDAHNYGEVVKSRASSLRTLPAFYAIQVAGRCPFECTYCPYPGFCRSGKGISPGIPATGRKDFMSLADFTSIVRKIANFSEDAVVSLSLWGECSFHPEIAGLVSAVLAFPGLSVLIETTGTDWKDETLEAIASAVSTSVPRANGQKPVTWIVSLDAAGSACYGTVHGLNQVASGTDAADRSLRTSVSCTERIESLFPGAVWPQMVRMNENETELETFYRFWKQKYGRVIIQKHDHFCRSIEDRRVADLSPLVRNPCWHLKRDMSILIDGTVPLCREDIYANRTCGNAIRDDFSAIWAKTGSGYEQQLACVYEGMCGACDEYYTYNF